MKKILLILLFLFFVCPISARDKAEEGKGYRLQDNTPDFYFDAVVFKSPTPDKERIDIYALIPYKTLNFAGSENKFGSEYELLISIYDSAQNLVRDKTVKRRPTTDDYPATLGASGEFDPVKVQVELPAGKYRIETVLRDRTVNREFTRSRDLALPDLSSYEFCLSGILLISAIEETAGKKYKITPHVDDNIAGLEEGWFIFFEVYNSGETRTVDLKYSVIDEKSESVFGNIKRDVEIPKGTSQKYFYVQTPSDLPAGKYILQVRAEQSGTTIATTQRSLSNKGTFGTYVMQDIDDAVNKLYYVAEGDDIDYIESAEDEAEKKKRFQEFWETLDPSPGTARNEAFDEYYLRIKYAEDKFGRSSRGWRSDRGHVYVVFGPPMRVEEIRDNYSSGRVYERWVYASNRQFLFLDKSGFGDYMLVEPPAIIEKYEYKTR